MNRLPADVDRLRSTPVALYHERWEQEPARKAFKQGEWNTFRIECRGDTIKTWLNGIPAANLKDAVNSSGFIALQVHGVGKRTEALEVRFRNLRLKELK